MLELHHGRMVTRLSNILDTQMHRGADTDVIFNELRFLAGEAEAYRAFVHQQATALDPLVHLDGGAVTLCQAADSLYFEVLHLNDLIERDGPNAPKVKSRIARAGATFLDHIRQCHQGILRARADRLRAARALAPRGGPETPGETRLYRSPSP